MEQIIGELRNARAMAGDEGELLARVRAVAQRAVARKSEWLRPDMCAPDPDQGFGAYLLHEETDHTLAVFVVNWLPGRGTPPHDHGTWAVIAGIEGEECNSFWKKVAANGPHGPARIAKVSERTFGPGDVLAMRSGALHSLSNDSDQSSLSLHMYGRHFNYTRRSRFDPVSGFEMPYEVTVINESATARDLAEAAE